MKQYSLTCLKWFLVLIMVIVLFNYIVYPALKIKLDFVDFDADDVEYVQLFITGIPSVNGAKVSSPSDIECIISELNSCNRTGWTKMGPLFSGGAPCYDIVFFFKDGKKLEISYTTKKVSSFSLFNSGERKMHLINGNKSIYFRGNFGICFYEMYIKYCSDMQEDAELLYKLFLANKY